MEILNCFSLGRNDSSMTGTFVQEQLVEVGAAASEEGYQGPDSKSDNPQYGAFTWPWGPCG